MTRHSTPAAGQPSLFDPAPERDVVLTPAELAHRLGESYPPTPEQTGAVAAPLQPHVVVAGAGSGKTQTMGLRVVWLVANGLVEPHRVLGLTFTRKAAAELGERVRRMLSRLRHAHDSAPFLADDVAAALRTGEPTVTTYHSYAAALVGEHALRIGLEPSTRLVGEAVSWQYAAQVVEAYDGAMDAVDRAVTTVVGDVLALAAELSEHLQEPADVVALTEKVRTHLERLPRAVGQRTPTTTRTSRICWRCSRPGSRCCRWSATTPRPSSGAASWTTATRWPSPPASPSGTLRSATSSAAATARCCSTSTRTPARRSGCCSRRCSPAATRSPRSAIRGSPSTAGAARARATWSGSARTSPASGPAGPAGCR